MKKSGLTESFKYAANGIIKAVKDERNMKIHLVFAALVIVFGFVLRISSTEWLFCIVLISLVIGGEMFNTAIEAAVDLISPEYSELAKKAKDVSAGAVLVFAAGAAVSGVIIFVPKLFSLFS